MAKEPPPPDPVYIPLGGPASPLPKGKEEPQPPSPRRGRPPKAKPPTAPSPPLPSKASHLDRLIWMEEELKKLIARMNKLEIETLMSAGLPNLTKGKDHE